MSISNRLTWQILKLIKSPQVPRVDYNMSSITERITPLNIKKILLEKYEHLSRVFLVNRSHKKTLTS